MPNLARRKSYPHRGCLSRPDLDVGTDVTGFCVCLNAVNSCLRNSKGEAAVVAGERSYVLQIGRTRCDRHADPRNRPER